MAKFSYSIDEENYTGAFGTLDEACREAITGLVPGNKFWAGEQTEPPGPESYWRAGDWLEHVACQDEYCIDAAEGWSGANKEQLEELEAQVRAVMAAWLDKHDLRPAFWLIEKPQQFVATEAGYEAAT